MILADQTAFSHLIHPPLANRNEKPRLQGITMALDKGLGYYQLRDLLELHSPYVDLFKLGFGTSSLYTTHLLRNKLSLLRLYSVHASPGGTLTEIALQQNCFEEYVKTCKKFGFTALEISDGSIPLSQEVRLRSIIYAKKTMQQVITEVGKKTGEARTIESYSSQIIADLTAGADYVIMEGRENGEGAGIYDDHGSIQVDMLEAIIEQLSQSALERVIWEAPQKHQQVDLILRFGNNVNLGNLPPSDILALECLRLGLRGDTLQMADSVYGPYTTESVSGKRPSKM